MKRVTASDARRHWFRLLDEVAEGEVVCIERGGRRILLQRESTKAVGEPTPDYRPLLRAPRADQADGWAWEWDDGEGGLRLHQEPERS